MTDNLVGRLRAAATGYYTEKTIADAADRIEQLQAALQLAIEMRLLQKLYFKERTPDLLISSKMSEAAFDRAMMEKTDD
jgi:hypothetical protein